MKSGGALVAKITDIDRQQAAASKKRKALTSTPKRTRAGTNKKKLVASRTDKGEDGTGGANQQQQMG